MVRSTQDHYLDKDMSRVLKRPMFKMGGSASAGITSGLDKPRQNYQDAGPVNPFITIPNRLFPTTRN